MKTLLILTSLAALCQAGVRRPDGSDAVVVREVPSNNVGADGYRYAYELSDGQSRDEAARIEVQGPERAVNRVSGSYSWTNPADGQIYTVNYVADEHGYRAVGLHLPGMGF